MRSDWRPLPGDRGGLPLLTSVNYGPGLVGSAGKASGADRQPRGLLGCKGSKRGPREGSEIHREGTQIDDSALWPTGRTHDGGPRTRCPGIGAAWPIRRSTALTGGMVATVRKKGGTDHPDTLICESYLAHDLRHLGLRDEAAGLITHVIDTRRKVLGPEHPDTKSAQRFLETLD